MMPINSKRVFAGHFGEMLVVMLLGMGVLEGLAALAFTAASASLTGQPGGFRVMLMGLSMTVPMVLWISYRGHSARRNAEMATSMLMPSALAAALVASGAFGLGVAFAVQHAVMVPAMLAVMLSALRRVLEGTPSIFAPQHRVCPQFWPEPEVLTLPGPRVTVNSQEHL